MSLCAREKWAIGRRLHAGRLRPRFSASRLSRLRRGDDAGFGIVEAVVSVALLALVVVPVTHLAIATESSSNALHLRVEASDLATQALETAQYQTANGVNPTAGITTSTQYSGKDPFTVTLDWELVAGTGAASTICIAPPGQLSSRIWTVKATVSWGHNGGQQGHVVATTLVSPALADLADNNAAEIAVPVYNSDDATLETTTPINITVTGSCAGSQCSGETVPSNESTTESANTGSTGCAVFADLFAGAGWTYNVTVSPVSPYVDPNELSNAATATGQPTRTGISVQANTVTVVSNPNIILAPGATTTVKFQTMSFAGGTSAVTPAPYLPISVQSSTLLCSSLAAETCVIGNGSTAFNSSSASAQTALLYPGPAVTGTNPNYSAWAGDQADSEPSYQDSNGDAVYGSDVATSFQAVVEHDRNDHVARLPAHAHSGTLKSDAGTVTKLTAVDAGGGDTMTLNGTSGTVATGLPLGQFQILATVSGSNPAVSVTSSHTTPVYVWMLPTGYCESSSPQAAPCSSPLTTALGVTVG